jgi:hypothetical protein
MCAFVLLACDMLSLSLYVSRRLRNYHAVNTENNKAQRHSFLLWKVSNFSPPIPTFTEENVPHHDKSCYRSLAIDDLFTTSSRRQTARPVYRATLHGDICRTTQDIIRQHKVGIISLTIMEQNRFTRFPSCRQTLHEHHSFWTKN